MKHKLGQLFVAILCVSIFIISSNHNLASAQVANWQKAASFSPRSQDDFASTTFRESLKNFADVGGNHATLIIPIRQANLNSNSLYSGWNTPSDASLRSAIEYAQSLELQVSLKIHADVDSGQWRADIDPHNRDAWFDSYANYLYHFAAIAQEMNVDQYILGAEIYSMTSPQIDPLNTSRWNSMIANVRSIYSGLLSYSAQRDGDHDERGEIQFWNNLDSIGISGYFPLATHTHFPTVDDIVASWDHWNDSLIRPVHEQWGKPVIFTEIGYRSLEGAHYHPWAWEATGPADMQGQVNLFEGLFQYWDTIPYFQGIHIWEWLTYPWAGGEGDTYFTVQNKPAEDVISKWFTETSHTIPTPTPEVPVTELEWNIGSSFTPTIPIVDAETTIRTTVSANETINNLIIDLEIYNLSGDKVFQEFFENQTIDATAKIYEMAWKPSHPGNFRVAVGIFSSNWSQLHHWENENLTITVSQDSQDASPTPTVPPPTLSPTPSPVPTEPVSPPTDNNIDIWWPTDGSIQSGTQPFKAIVSNLNADEYKMYWQVDGDALNEMHTSFEEYPHKASWVELNDWSWRSSGLYAINFIAYNMFGHIISEKEITIFVH